MANEAHIALVRRLLKTEVAGDSLREIVKENIICASMGIVLDPNCMFAALAVRRFRTAVARGGGT